ncbi:MAG: UDP-3-O-(3-hydroxymyristoyl)glucosamine N-acyltransferase [Candidatus Marinimicrobia bacterium]|nr:UDP-3-O-(3-hydroxymyristoyl)glucosamine N-acyltransferase [Candidatus Neomarinimicrobiota bacterium]MDP6594058.1 UDP-3-O-(3-hydroxymyristoyl)glucosamine N-acyltransferase [Candidatus Neomarinimicrobiota bacterium]MDP6836553.1 UDP-3-O-(3-hydroxymyristoyl)glucosamine N-acyltransferase [Candidatus Neomarinimicrobiota bacterium]
MTTLKELANLVGGEIVGDPETEISGVAELENAPPGTISFLSIPKYKRYLKSTKASAVVISKETEADEMSAAILVENPTLSFAAILDYFSPALPHEREVHPTVSLGKNVKLGKDVAVGPYTVIEDDVTVGDGVVIGPSCVVGSSTSIGTDSELKYHVTLYHDCVIGENVLVHSGTVIGSDGFGFTTEKGIHYKVPQIGGVVVEDDVEIGANCAIDRGTIGNTVIGKGTKLDNLVHIAHNVKLGKGCLVTGQAAIAGSTVIGDYVAFGGQSGVTDHVEVGSNARIAAKSGVTKSIPGDKTYSGMPAKEIRQQNRLDALLNRLPELVKKINAVEQKINELERVK